MVQIALSSEIIILVSLTIEKDFLLGILKVLLSISRIHLNIGYCVSHALAHELIVELSS